MVGGSGACFGPSTQEYYDMSKWAVTRSAAAVNEIYPDVEPPHRGRHPGEPVMLKPHPSEGYLPALLTILASIPLAQELFLCRERVASDYGVDDRWWSGESIPSPVLLDLAGVDSPDDLQPLQDLLCEVQRLMAFMMASARSYGSVNALMATMAMPMSDQYLDAKVPVEHFLAAWSKAIKELVRNERALNLFQIEAMREDSANPDDSEAYPFYLLEAQVPYWSDIQTSTIYDAIDEFLWGNDPNGTKSTNFWLSQVPEVVVMNLRQPDAAQGGLRMSVPASFYVDRYLSQYVGDTKLMRQNRARLGSSIIEIQTKKQMLFKFEYATLDEDGKWKEMPNNSSKHLLESVIASLKKGQGGASNGLVGDADDLQFDNARTSELIERLQKINQKVQDKLILLDQQAAELRLRIEEISNLLKDPAPESGPTPEHRLNLCGVSAHGDITYVLYPSVADPSVNVWWKVEYFNSPYLAKNQVSEDEVLQVAGENKDVLLVYASDAAIAPDPNGVFIPDPLQRFVDVDNQAFQEELNNYVERNNDWRAGDEPPPYSSDDSFGFVPDPGEGVVSNEEFVQSTGDTGLEQYHSVKQQLMGNSANTATSETYQVQSNGALQSEEVEHGNVF